MSRRNTDELPILPAPVTEPQPGGEVHVDEWVAPDVCDEHGLLRAGKVLEWMDVVGALAATRWGRQPAVTVAVDGCELLELVRVGERVTMRARVAHTSGRTIGVAVSMTVQRSRLDAPRRVLAGYMTFVVVDDTGKPAPVPAFSPQTPEELALHREGALRREFHRELTIGQAVLARPELLIDTPDGPRREAMILDVLREMGMKLAGKRWRTTGLRSPQLSYVHKIEPVRGGKLDFHGTLYGGTLMRWIEGCGAMSASAFVDGPMRLRGVHGLQFLAPVVSNVFVHLSAKVAHSSPDAVTVHVQAQAEDPLSRSITRNVRGFLTYEPVAGDVVIPGVARADAEEAELYCEVSLRLALRDKVAMVHEPR